MITTDTHIVPQKKRDSLSSLAKAMKVMELLNNPETSISTLGREIGSYEALAERVLRIVNSPLYALPRHIAAIDFAVSVLGFEKIKQIVLSNHTINIMQAKVDEYLNQKPSWENSDKSIEVTLRLINDIAAIISSDDSLNNQDDEDENKHPIIKTSVEEARKKIITALKMLPQRERLIMMLYYYEDATFEEIGLILGISVQRIAELFKQTLKAISRHIESVS